MKRLSQRDFMALSKNVYVSVSCNKGMGSATMQKLIPALCSSCSFLQRLSFKT